MAVRRPSGMRKGKSSSNKKKYYRQICPRCEGSGLITEGNMYGVADFPCPLCGRTGRIELTYFENQVSSSEQGEKLCQYIVDKLNDDESISGLSYCGSEHQTESLIQKNKHLDAIYRKLNEI